MKKSMAQNIAQKENALKMQYTEKSKHMTKIKVRNNAHKNQITWPQKKAPIIGICLRAAAHKLAQRKRSNKDVPLTGQWHMCRTSKRKAINNHNRHPYSTI